MLRSSCDKSLLVVLFLVGLTVFSGAVLASPSVIADDDTVIDEVDVVVPTSCTMNGTGMYSHTATINNGTYASDIGTTTFNVYCNDKDGFAIYAIGYTEDTDGKNVLTNSTLGSAQDIATGTGTSGNSQWAMKLTTDANATYPLSIQNGYGAYHTVPDDYELVAKRTSSTDIGAAATGSSFTSTYQVFISSTQLAGTYLGQVKYVMVHPNYVSSDAFEDAVSLIFDGNGLTFPNGDTTNVLKYAEVCKPGESGYVGNTYREAMTSNITDGIQDGPYASDESILQPITITGADKLKVVVKYGFSDADGVIIEGDWSGGYEPEYYELLYSYENNEETFIFDGDTITVYFASQGSAYDYDYGLYVKAYPVYDTEQPGTTWEEFPSGDCTVLSFFGTYMETVTWKGKWIAEIPYEDCYWDYELEEDVCTSEVDTADFSNYDEIYNYVSNNYENLSGKTIHLTAYNPYTIIYNGNGSTLGDMEGSQNEFEDLSEQVILLAPNYAKTGYGFAGWSSNPNTVVNGNGVIYGPNETITGSDLSYDGNKSSTLYAVWVQSSGNMQNYSCSALSSGQVTALTDLRDGNVYTVGKMQDGNCWMMENLRLDNTSLLTTDDTNVGSIVFNYLPSSSDEWCGTLTSWCISQPKLNINNTQIGGVNSHGDNLIPTPISGERSKNYQWYGYGNYYNYYSATAGTGTYSTSNAKADGDICPKGWFLPLENSSFVNPDNGSFVYLDKMLGGTGVAQETAEASNRWRKYPINFILSGLYYGDPMDPTRGSGAEGLGLRADYRTGWAGHENMAVVFQIEVDAIIPSLNSYKYSGYSIRCLAR